MNEIMKEMNKEEFSAVFIEELFDEIHKMIEDKKLSKKNATVFLKHIGYCKIMDEIRSKSFDSSSLYKRIQEMILDEEKKKGRKNERLMIDLCECCLLLNNKSSSKIPSVCLSYLLKAALNKEKNEEAQKEVEMALLALSNVKYLFVETELYLREIKEIIQYHQEHCNLTRLAYQSAWKFLMNRFEDDSNLEEVYLNDLHFVREVASEVEVLAGYIDWKNNEKDEEMKRMEKKNVVIAERWLDMIHYFFVYFEVHDEERIKLISCMTSLCRAAINTHNEIVKKCYFILMYLMRRQKILPIVSDLLKEGIIDYFMEEIQRSTMDDVISYGFFRFVQNIYDSLEGNEDNETDDAKRKAKRQKMIEKLEEEGYEDINTSLCGPFVYLSEKHWCSYIFSSVINLSEDF
eukprot:MONOS_1325.1-p1 / transcript=MONOS_1325.1 / gene=MONOS_1325 / organism=Monocercomonoides_exilis_PA203 / gene_product=unspecified product / transcript_product=unspecified product / location=Mono_scaffold00023:2244-3512(+) / protein_length=404 / sequence_SO=supercontig / SO=protein_coding / is_pseudo=false